MNPSNSTNFGRPAEPGGTGSCPRTTALSFASAFASSTNQNAPNGHVASAFANSTNQNASNGHHVTSAAGDAHRGDGGNYFRFGHHADAIAKRKTLQLLPLPSIHNGSTSSSIYIKRSQTEPFIPVVDASLENFQGKFKALASSPYCLSSLSTEDGSFDDGSQDLDMPDSPRPRSTSPKPPLPPRAVVTRGNEPPVPPRDLVTNGNSDHHPAQKSISATTSPIRRYASNSVTTSCVSRLHCRNTKNLKLATPPHSLSQPCIPSKEAGPSKILNWLYLGSQEDALDQDVLKENNIGYVLNLSTQGPKPDWVPDERFKRIPVQDSHTEKLLPYFDEAFKFIDKARENKTNALVHCLAGISRSPTLAIAYVMKIFNIGYEDAYKFVKEKRKIICPNLNFLGQLVEFEQSMSDGKRHSSPAWLSAHPFAPKVSEPLSVNTAPEVLANQSAEPKSSSPTSFDLKSINDAMSTTDSFASNKSSFASSSINNASGAKFVRRSQSASFNKSELRLDFGSCGLTSPNSTRNHNGKREIVERKPSSAPPIGQFESPPVAATKQDAACAATTANQNAPTTDTTGGYCSAFLPKQCIIGQFERPPVVATNPNAAYAATSANQNAPNSDGCCSAYFAKQKQCILALPPQLNELLADDDDKIAADWKRIFAGSGVPAPAVVFKRVPNVEFETSFRRVSSHPKLCSIPSVGPSIDSVSPAVLSSDEDISDCKMEVTMEATITPFGEIKEASVKKTMEAVAVPASAPSVFVWPPLEARKSCETSAENRLFEHLQRKISETQSASAILKAGQNRQNETFGEMNKTGVENLLFRDYHGQKQAPIVDRSVSAVDMELKTTAISASEHQNHKSVTAMPAGCQHFVGLKKSISVNTPLSDLSPSKNGYRRAPLVASPLATPEITISPMETDFEFDDDESEPISELLTSSRDDRKFGSAECLERSMHNLRRFFERKRASWPRALPSFPGLDPRPCFLAPKSADATTGGGSCRLAATGIGAGQRQRFRSENFLNNASSNSCSPGNPGSALTSWLALFSNNQSRPSGHVTTSRHPYDGSDVSRRSSTTHHSRDVITSSDSGYPGSPLRSPYKDPDRDSLGSTKSLEILAS